MVFFCSSILKVFIYLFFCPLSEVKVYDPSGDSTIPSTSKKRKFEEVEEEEEGESEPVTPVVKTKKAKKETVKEGSYIF